MSFPKQPVSPNFFAIEEEILQYWKENKTFERSIETRSEDNPYRFYDGPPFITGLPHYGSLLSSVAKDIVTRFRTQKGKRIERVWGRDCHGFYVEQKVQEKLGLKSNKDIEAHGIKPFIDACYEFTKDVSDQRGWYVDHLGRWVDFQNAYKTMDNDYMESVMRVFKSLREKGLIYEGKRVSLYSTKLNTPISNYEVALDNSYADIADPAITVKFPVNGFTKHPKTTYFKEKWHINDQWVLEVALGIVKDTEWRVLTMYDEKHGRRHLPWGKADEWESLEEALMRECKEELWVTVRILKKIGTNIFMANNHGARHTFFEVEVVEWEPKCIEPTHHDLTYAELFEADNAYHFGAKIQNLIFEDEENIFDQLNLLYQYHLVTKQSEFGTQISFLARTTTPRTIPANLALVVHSEIYYVQLYDIKANEYFILAENLIHKYYKDSSDYRIIYKCKGVELEGISYKAPFDYYVWQINNNNFKVYLADYVTESDGTGIVHTAPEFGEDDFKTGLKYNLTQTEALDEGWNYSTEISDYTGVYYRDANDLIIERLKTKDLLVKKESITHSVAMCPRTNIPLIYKTQDNRFIDIKSVKEQLIKENQKINRVPGHLKEGRFLKSMESAPDRCISRTKYRATPMPVRESDSGDRKVLGSKEEIYDLDQTGSKILEKRELNGKIIYRDTLNNKELDLHRPYIDAVRGVEAGQKFSRVPQVLDPWLESGSMPYAQVHYPFEHKEKFEKSFPADYVAEYLGQVRCRFFFMHALGVMLFENPAFLNVICTWVLAGNDGRKMSKSYGNYPDPMESMKTHGSDSLRMYFSSNPIVEWWDMNFYEEGRKEIIRKINLPLRNSYVFFTTYANIDGFVPSKFSINDFVWYEFKNDLDEWIIWKTAQLIIDVNGAMEAYMIQKASSPIFTFMEDLTNRYIRRNRRRFWRSENDDDKMSGYDVLYVVLIELCKVLAPFMPFLTEYIFRNLTGKESVHLEYWTENQKLHDLINQNLLQEMDLIKMIIEVWLSLRASLKLKVKQPLQNLKINKTINKAYEGIILDELNIKELSIDKELNNQIIKICIPNAKILGKKLGARFGEINNLAKSGQFKVLQDEKVQVLDVILEENEYEMRFEKWDLTGDLATRNDLILMMDTTITPTLKLEWDTRELIRAIQEARKQSNYDVSDRIELLISWANSQEIIENYADYINNETLSKFVQIIEEADYSGKCELDTWVIVFEMKKQL